MQCVVHVVSLATGVLIYEMLCGYPPFSDDNNFSTYEKILSGKIDWPKSFDPIAKDLVKKLLTNDRTKRIGCMKVSKQIRSMMSGKKYEIEMEIKVIHEFFISLIQLRMDRKM